MRLAVLLAALLLAGCSSSSPSDPASPTTTSPSPAAVSTLPPELLPGQDWLLVDATVTPNPGSFRVTLRFSDGQVAGQAPVNRYSGQVTLGPGTIQTAGIASTKMAGSPQGMAAEQAYLDALGAATTWEVMDEMLTLSDATGPLLVFAAPDSVPAFAASLVGLPTKQAKRQITEAGYEVRVVSVDGDSRPVTMDFRPDRINLTLVDGVVTKATQG